jgi:hypothetical protein
MCMVFSTAVKIERWVEFDQAAYLRRRAQWPSMVDGDEEMSRQPVPPWLVERLAQLNSCDSYVIVTIDPEFDEIDAQGPLNGLEAVFAAHELRRELDESDLGDIQIRIVRLHLTEPARPVIRSA